MLSDTPPPVGVNLLRPLSLPALERELLNMQAIVKQCGSLPGEYQPLFDRCQNAWEFYRPLQTPGHQLHIDQLIANVYGYILTDEHC